MRGTGKGRGNLLQAVRGVVTPGVILLFHTAWLTVEVSQERNVSPTAMPLSLNDIVTLVRTSSAPATAFYQHAKSLLNVIVKCCSTLYTVTVAYTPPLFVHFDDNFSKWTCVSQ